MQSSRSFAGALFLLSIVLAPPAWGQITTSTVSGTVKDQQGAVVPGATVTLVSDTKQSMLPPVVSNETGDFVVTNVFADSYTIQIEMPSFKTLKRSGVQVSAGTPVTVGSLTLEVGGGSEVVTVTSEAPLIQASSGERSFAVSTAQVENLPVTNRSFLQYAAHAPGVADNLQRIGGGGQTNVMMDGVSTMDTGNNGIILQLTNESIAEIKVVTSSYQAEFGRSSGLQVSVVTKSGTNQFRGGFYDIERSSAWNSNNKANILNGDPKPKFRQRDWGYSIGGPIGRAGGSNKLFFFFTQEFSPRTGGNDVVRFRLPTAAERAGDFSQTYDNNGALYPFVKDPLLPGACNATTQAGCFADGGVVGRIPANRLYQPGLNILKMWPMLNVDGAGLAYNYQVTRPEETLQSTQPVLRLDYQPLDRLRGSFKVARWMQQNKVFNGTIPGFNDAKQNHPVVSLYTVTVDYTLTPSMVLEATYGRSQNERAGCTPGGQVGPIFCTAGIGNQAGIPMAPIANLNNAGLQNLPLLYPDAHIINPDYYAYFALTQLVPSPVFVDGRVQKPPNFVWGNRIAAANTPPNIPWPNYLNINPTHDVAISLTKVAGNHTLKTGLYINRSFKAENQGNNAFGVQSTSVYFDNQKNGDTIFVYVRR